MHVHTHICAHNRTCAYSQLARDVGHVGVCLSSIVARRTGGRLGYFKVGWWINIGRQRINSVIDVTVATRCGRAPYSVGTMQTLYSSQQVGEFEKRIDMSNFPPIESTVERWWVWGSL